MPSLESSSPDLPRSAPTGRLLHAPFETLTRHPHEHAFAAVVLSGGYVEAGDTGRHRLTPGDVLLHRAWESHLDRFEGRGAEVLILPVEESDTEWAIGRIADPDALVRAAEVDPVEAVRQLQSTLGPKAVAPADWPDLLAYSLTTDPELHFGAWADAHGLHVGSLSRGFRQVFAVTPSAYRLIQRTRQAVRAARRTTDPLHRIAQDCGFADQAHMTRAVRCMTRTTPSALRKRA